MGFFRKLIATLFSSLVLLTLLLASLAFSLDHNFATPKRLESWLSASNIYSTGIKQALQNAQNDSKDSSNAGGISLTNAAVNQAAQTAFTATLLETSVNQFLDNNYSWLQGKIAQPNFVIDLSSAKQTFADQVSKYAQTRYASLPMCSTGQLAQVQNADPLLISCQSSSLSPAAEGTQVNQQISQSKDFLSNPKITADTITTKGQAYYKTYSRAPSFYSWAIRAWWILLLIAIVLSGLTILTHPSRRKGLKMVLRTISTAGLILIVGKFAADYLLKHLQSRVTVNANLAFVHDPAISLMTNFEKAITTSLFYWGIALFAVASAMLIGMWIPKHQEKPKTATQGPKVNNSSTKPAGHDEDFLSDRPSETNYLDDEPRAVPKPSAPATQAKPKKRNLVQ